MSQKKNKEKMDNLIHYIETHSARYKAFKKIIGDYLYDKVNMTNYEPILVYEIKGGSKASKEEFKDIESNLLSMQQLIEKIESLDSSVIDDYYWWRHFYSYYEEVSELLTEFVDHWGDYPDITGPYDVDGTFYEKSYIQSFEKEYIEAKMPEPVTEFCITLRFEWVRKMHSVQVMEYSLSGYSLYDAIDEWAHSEYSYLEEWQSPREIKAEKHRQKLEADAQLQKEKELKRIASVKAQFEHKYNHLIQQYSTTLKVAYKKLLGDLSKIDNDTKQKIRLEKYTVALDSFKQQYITKIENLSSKNNEPSISSDLLTFQVSALSSIDSIAREIQEQTTLIFWQGYENAKDYDSLTETLSDFEKLA